MALMERRVSLAVRCLLIVCASLHKFHKCRGKFKRNFPRETKTLRDVEKAGRENKNGKEKGKGKPNNAGK